QAPHKVGLEPDDGIAAAHGAALDRLEQEAHGRAGDLEEGRNRRLQVGHQGGPDHLRHAAPVTLGEGVRRRFDVHRDWLYGSPPPITWRRAGWLMVTPTSLCSRTRYCPMMSSARVFFRSSSMRLASADAASSSGTMMSVTRNTVRSVAFWPSAEAAVPLGVLNTSSITRDGIASAGFERLMPVAVSTLRPSACARS